MSQYPYSLEKYKNPASNIICSGCGEKRARAYINNATGERLGDHVSRCERVDSCGYHYTPKMFFEENPDFKPSDFQKWQRVEFTPPPPTDYIDKRLFESTLGFNEQNTFHRFLVTSFGKERAFNLIDKYNIGTNTFTKDKFKARLNRTIFWQVDLEGKVRTGQCVKYNASKSEETFLKIDCNRDKHPDYENYTCHLESVNFKEFNLKQCLFGEHLLTDNRTVAIVESAKSAIIASVYYPQFVWVSCEGKEGLNLDKLKVLKGRNVVLFPDLSKITEKKAPTAFELWTAKAQEMRAFCKSVVVSDKLEKDASDKQRASGADLADFLLGFPAPAEPLPAVSPIEPAPKTEPAPASTPLNSFEIRAKLISEWFATHGSVFDGVFILDNLAIPDIRNVIVYHLQIIDNNDSASIVSVKFLERMKVALMGK